MLVELDPQAAPLRHTTTMIAVRAVTPRLAKVTNSTTTPGTSLGAGGELLDDGVEEAGARGGAAGRIR